jgi:hypothetical protein
MTCSPWEEDGSRHTCPNNTSFARLWTKAGGDRRTDPSIIKQFVAGLTSHSNALTFFFALLKLQPLRDPSASPC